MGAAYPTARRVQSAVTQPYDRIAQTVREALSGRFRECVMETQWRGRSPIASLYFLVERRALPAFRAAFGSIAAAEAALKLSGPWPPYKFALSQESGEE
jgi:hypothetical protein